MLPTLLHNVKLRACCCKSVTGLDAAGQEPQLLQGEPIWLWALPPGPGILQGGRETQASRTLPKSSGSTTEPPWPMWSEWAALWLQLRAHPQPPT